MESLLKVGQWGIACDAACTYVLYFDSGISIRQSQVNAFADDDNTQQATHQIWLILMTI